jgi:hypothetical protein
MLVPASRSVVADCRVTARIVGYPVPCPMKVPRGTPPTGFVGPATGHSWRGWVAGSSYASGEHLVLTATPRPLRNDAKVVNGPAWYPYARVTPLAWIRINGLRMRAVYVPPATNDGSAFMNHVVLIWTVGRHTYGVGFHNVSTIRETLLEDVELARSIELVHG